MIQVFNGDLLQYNRATLLSSTKTQTKAQ